MKKFIIMLLILLNISSVWFIHAAGAGKCGDIKSTDTSLWQLMDDCKPGWAMEAKSSKWWGLIKVVSNDWYKIENAKAKIYAVTQKAIILASLLAIGWLVYAWILFTTAYWEDAKHKKAKDAVKYSLIWLALAFLSQQIINAVINFVYWLWG